MFGVFRWRGLLVEHCWGDFGPLLWLHNWYQSQVQRQERLEVPSTREASESSRCLRWSPSTVRPVSPMLVFQLSKQQNRTRTTSSTVLGTPPNRTQTKTFPLEELRGDCFLSWVLNWESTEDWDFRRLEPYTQNRTRTPPECCVLSVCDSVTHACNQCSPDCTWAWFSWA